VRNHLVRFEEAWQRDLMMAPQRMPTLKVVEAMEEALECDYSDGFSMEAWQIQAHWRSGQNKLSADRVRFEPHDANLAARIRMRKLRVNGRRLWIDAPNKRMMAWKMQEGSLYIELPSNEALDAILSAPGLPIPYREKLHGQYKFHRPTDPESLLSKPEIARHCASIEVNNLLASLIATGIFPPKLNVSRHTERLVASGEAFSELLFDALTDRIWAPEPRSRLAYLRQEIADFLLHARVRYTSESLEKMSNARGRERDKASGIRPNSPLEFFIADALRPAYERIFNRRCTITRNDQGPSGAFISFALSFFEHIGFRRVDSRGKVHLFPSAETIARAVRSREPKRDFHNPKKPAPKRSRSTRA